MARRRVIRAARRIAFSSMPVSVLQGAARVTTPFRVSSLKKKDLAESASLHVYQRWPRRLVDHSLASGQRQILACFFRR